MGTTEGVPTTDVVGFEKLDSPLVDHLLYVPQVCFTYHFVFIFMRWGTLHVIFWGGVNLE